MKKIYTCFLSILLIVVVFLFHNDLVSAGLTSEQRTGIEEIERRLLAFEGQAKQWRIQHDNQKLETEYCQLTTEEIQLLSQLTIEALQNDDILLQLKLPKTSKIVIAGDLHGGLSEAVTLVQYAKSQHCPIVFLGDYIDRGYNSFETLSFLYAQKILYPDQVFLIRGNHDSYTPIAQPGTFRSELNTKRKGDCDVQDVYTKLCEGLDYLTHAAVLSNEAEDTRIFCVHAGLSPNIKSLEQIQQIQRPFRLTADAPSFDMFWTDPYPDENCSENFPKNPERPGALAFSKNVLSAFLKENGLTKMIRGHQKTFKGGLLDTPCLNYKDGSIITLHSVVDYCEQRNTGDFAVLYGDDMRFKFFRIDQSFQITEPVTPQNMTYLPFQVPAKKPPVQQVHYLDEDPYEDSDDEAVSIVKKTSSIPRGSFIYLKNLSDTESESENEDEASPIPRSGHIDLNDLLDNDSDDDLTDFPTVSIAIGSKKQIWGHTETPEG